MAISLESIQYGISEAPPIILIHGPEGVGKTKFVANAPAPFLSYVEEGLGKLNVPRLPVASYQDLLDHATMLIQQPHNFKTWGIDSADHLEPFIWGQVVQDNPIASKGRAASDIESYGYGKGYVMAMDYWREIMEIAKFLKNNRDMMTVIIAHTAIRRFEPPDGEAYDRYQIKLQENSKGAGAAALIRESVDAILFANYKTHLTEEKKGDKVTRKRAMGSGDRVIYTEERPAYQAKNRYDLPHVIPLDREGDVVWGTLSQHIPWLSKFGNTVTEQPQANVSEQPQTEGA